MDLTLNLHMNKVPIAVPLSSVLYFKYERNGTYIIYKEGSSTHKPYAIDESKEDIDRMLNVKSNQVEQNDYTEVFEKMITSIDKLTAEVKNYKVKASKASK